LARETGNADGTRARIPNGKYSNFASLTSRALGAVQSALGVGERGNSCFGQVLVAVRQGERRDAFATGEEQLGRCAARNGKYVRLYLYSRKLIAAATYLRRVFVDGYPNKSNFD
jgi:hypothetical protein